MSNTKKYVSDIKVNGDIQCTINDDNVTEYISMRELSTGIDTAIEVAEGKTKTFIIEGTPVASPWNTDSSLVSATKLQIVGEEESDINIGDIILIQDTSVADRWVMKKQIIAGKHIQYRYICAKLETSKVDLDNYLKKDGLDKLTELTVDPSDGTYYITNGVAAEGLKTMYKRKHSCLWNYIKTKAVSYTEALTLSDTQKAQARTNIGAGTSNLALGTTATTAAAGNHGHTYGTAINQVLVTGESGFGVKAISLGSNLTIADGSISAKDTTYTAGTNITIDGTTISAKDTTYSNATSTTNGLMSKNDKTKLDNLTLNGVPIGAIIMWSGSTAPEGWLMCDGTTYTYSIDKLSPNAKYTALYNVIQHTYGGSGTNFNVPNLVQKFPLGAGGSSTLSTYETSLGKSGGEATHKLLTTEMPRHRHEAWASHSSNGTTGGNWHPYDTRGGYPETESDYAKFPGTYTGGPSGSTTEGDVTAHNNIPPFLAINFIIKYK